MGNALVFRAIMAVVASIITIRKTCNKCRKREYNCEMRTLDTNKKVILIPIKPTLSHLEMTAMDF